MTFSIGGEMPNLRLRKRAAEPVHLHRSYAEGGRVSSTEPTRDPFVSPGFDGCPLFGPAHLVRRHLAVVRVREIVRVNRAA
jgi:hypothetical protein